MIPQRPRAGPPRDESHGRDSSGCWRAETLGGGTGGRSARALITRDRIRRRRGQLETGRCLTRALKEPHGVGVGPASTVAPATATRRVMTSVSGTSKPPDGAGDLPADLHLIDVIGVGRVGQLECCPAGSEEGDPAARW